MGGIIGGIIGGIGSLFGGSNSSSADKQAAKQALTGYNYLTGSNGVTGYVGAGNNANNMTAQLLGAAPLQAGTSNAFKNYLNSTGYNFMLDSGSHAITGSAAARGILNSGATAKALTKYGQDVGSQYFNNYLTQLGDVAGRGLTASGQIGAAGTAGGGNASSATQAGGAAMGNGIATAAGTIGNTVANNWSGISNFFGGL